MRTHFSCLILALSVFDWSPAIAQPAIPTSDAEIVVTATKFDKRSRWLRAETDNFIIYGDLSEQEMIAEARALERFDQLLRQITHETGPPVRNRLSVYLVRGRDTLNRLRRQKFAFRTYATGFYSTGPEGTVLAADLRWNERGPKLPVKLHRAWLFSEYSRHFLIEHTNGPAFPTWYIDGLAQYLGPTEIDDTSVRLGLAHPGAAYTMESHGLLGLRSIITGQITSGLAYSASVLLFVHYILSDPKLGKAFQSYTKAIRGGTPPEAAFRKAFDVGFEGMSRRLANYRKTASYVRATAAGAIDPNVYVSRLPSSADELLLDQAAMQIGVPEYDRQREILVRARRTWEQRADPFSRRIYARALITFGDPSAAENQVAKLLAVSPGDPEILYMEGLRHLMTARKNPPGTIRNREEATARRWFSRAYAVDDGFYPALYRYTESRLSSASFLSQNNAEVLLEAARLAPHSSQIQASAALLLMARGEHSLAQPVIDRMMKSPRDPSSGLIERLQTIQAEKSKPNEAEIAATFYQVNYWKDLNCC